MISIPGYKQVLWKIKTETFVAENLKCTNWWSSQKKATRVLNILHYFYSVLLTLSLCGDENTFRLQKGVRFIVIVCLVYTFVLILNKLNSSKLIFKSSPSSRYYFTILLLALNPGVVCCSHISVSVLKWKLAIK